MVRDPLKIHEDARLILNASRALNAVHNDDNVTGHLVRLALYERVKARLPGANKARINRYVANVLAEAARIHTEEALDELARSHTDHATEETACPTN
ncbi:hypothetical protein [Bradyrhizobium sp. 153]|uniref:hypothetical protein n=1 Tax=Bradyrhizobium sp. 153 TaxID=2782627 RepID=UPI001FFA4CFE|nr:hypothetical protein [Bradyrhizobium sp. 153]MCK1668635.1 hypothetical protein [Bradyrhizobium sp. 153]